jgi:hypothetical protein
VVSAAIALWGLLAGCESAKSGASVAPDSIRWTARDNSGRQWELLAWKLPGATGQEEAKPERSKPLVGTVGVYRRSRELVNFSLQVATPAGEEVYSLTVAGRRPTEPTFTITDALGQEVARGNFEYG